MSVSLYRHVESPIGPLTLLGDGEALEAIRFPEAGQPARVSRGWQPAPRGFAEAARQLERYFAGGLRRFDLQLAPRGTPFQLAVWQALQDIQFGETESYSDIARRIGRASSVRAVGAANGRNPLPIIIPCHRVIGADGSLTGFGGGLPTKAWLLRHEAQASGRPLPAQAALFD